MEIGNCPSCKIAQYEIQEFCKNCNFPFNGTEKEKSIHIGRFINKKGVVQDSSNAIGNVRKILFVLAGLYVISIIVLFSNASAHWIDLAFNGFLVGIFLLCALLVKREPVFFTAFALVALVGVYILLAVIDPMSLLNGIIFKVLIVGSLLYSLLLSFKAKKFKKQYQMN